MPLQNRVTPFGDIVAIAQRGTWMGNRGGCLHDQHQQLGRARWRSRAWITCRLVWKDWHRAVMSPGRYTELFFLDEATALAAGHRPCALCRRADYNRFAAAWAQAMQGALPRAADMDRVLHAQRLASGGSLTLLPIRDLPDGAMLTLPDRPDTAWLLQGTSLRAWSPDGYETAHPCPDAASMVAVITPPAILKVLKAGYWPVTA